MWNNKFEKPIRTQKTQRDKTTMKKITQIWRKESTSILRFKSVCEAEIRIL